MCKQQKPEQLSRLVERRWISDRSPERRSGQSGLQGRGAGDRNSRGDAGRHRAGLIPDPEVQQQRPKKNPGIRTAKLVKEPISSTSSVTIDARNTLLPN